MNNFEPIFPIHKDTQLDFSSLKLITLSPDCKQNAFSFKKFNITMKIKLIITQESTQLNLKKNISGEQENYLKPKYIAKSLI